MSDSARTYRSRDGTTKIDRIVEMLRRDPDLHTWQIRARLGGISGTTVERARQIAGIPAPEPFTRGGRIGG